MTEAAYSKVTLPLRALLEGEFFTEYIKKGTPIAMTLEFIRSLVLGCISSTSTNIHVGDILMLSEGRRGVDKLYSLRNGKL